jgi:hypothetical protein
MNKIKYKKWWILKSSKRKKVPLGKKKPKYNFLKNPNFFSPASLSNSCTLQILQNRKKKFSQKVSKNC